MQDTDTDRRRYTQPFLAELVRLWWTVLAPPTLRLFWVHRPDFAAVLAKQPLGEHAESVVG